MKRTLSIALFCVLASSLLVGVTETSGLETPGYRKLWGYEYSYASGDVMASPVFTEGVRLSDGWWVDGEVWYRFEMPGPVDTIASLEVGVYGVGSNSSHGYGDGVDVHVWNVATDTWDYVGTTGMGEGPNSWTIESVNHITSAYPYELSIRVYAHDENGVWGIEDIYDLWYIDASYLLDTCWFSESFSEVNYYPFDTDLDGFDDAVEVEMNVDTTCDGTLDVFIYSYLLDPSDDYVGFDDPNWSINYNYTEYGSAYLYVPSNAPEGWYDIELYLFDACDNSEDYWNMSNAVYLYPPNMQELTIEVEGFGTTNPPPGSLWVANGTEVVVTAIPDAGSILDFWILDSINIGSENPMPLLMETDHVLKAMFIEELGRLTGTISDFDTGQAIANANVTGVSPENNFFVVANSSGQYQMSLPAGSYNVTAEKPGYINQTVTSVTIVVGATTIQDFQLQPLAPKEIETCNADGGQQDAFTLGETVYVTGWGYYPSTMYDLYIVADEETWVDGMEIPERVPDTALVVSANNEGHIIPAAAWMNPQTVGKFDIVVDVNGNGIYDSAIDPLDDNDVEVTAGFTIPEFHSFLALSMFMIATLAAVAHKKKQ